MSVSLGSRRHDVAFSRSAKLDDGSIKQVDRVEKIDRVGGQPIVRFLSGWADDCRLEISRSERGLGFFMELIAFCIFVLLFLLAESLVILVTVMKRIKNQ